MTPQMILLLVQCISGTSQTLQQYMDITWHITDNDDEWLQMTDGSEDLEDHPKSQHP